MEGGAAHASGATTADPGAAATDPGAFGTVRCDAAPVLDATEATPGTATTDPGVATIAAAADPGACATGLSAKAILALFADHSSGSSAPGSCDILLVIFRFTDSCEKKPNVSGQKLQTGKEIHTTYERGTVGAGDRRTARHSY